MFGRHGSRCCCDGGIPDRCPTGCTTTTLEVTISGVNSNWSGSSCGFAATNVSWFDKLHTVSSPTWTGCDWEYQSGLGVCVPATLSSGACVHTADSLLEYVVDTDFGISGTDRIIEVTLIFPTVLSETPLKSTGTERYKWSTTYNDSDCDTEKTLTFDSKVSNTPPQGSISYPYACSAFHLTETGVTVKAKVKA